MEREKEKREKKQLKLLDNLQHLVRHNAQERGALGKDERLVLDATTSRIEVALRGRPSGVDAGNEALVAVGAVLELAGDQSIFCKAGRADIAAFNSLSV